MVILGRDHEAELYDLLKEAQPSAEEHFETTQTDPADERVRVEKGDPKPFSSRNMFVHHDTHPIVLDIKLMDTYGVDWFEWEPETLWREIMDDFRTPSISDHVKSKIQATRTVHITDWSFTKWEIFCVLIQALNNNIPDFEIMRKPTTAQLFAGVDMMTHIRKDVLWSQEIQQWCGAALLDVGVTYAPPPIAFCQDEILEIQEELGNPVDPEPIREKYRVVASQPLEEVELVENRIDIQVAKLLIARDYMNMRRGQMTQQLRVLR